MFFVGVPMSMQAWLKTGSAEHGNNVNAADRAVDKPNGPPCRGP